MTDEQIRTRRIGALVGVLLGVGAVAVGVAETVGVVESAPPGLLIATGALLALSEAANVRHTLGDSAGIGADAGSGGDGDNDARGAAAGGDADGDAPRE